MQNQWEIIIFFIFKFMNNNKIPITLVLLVLAISFSCKKNKPIDLGNTTWNTKFKYVGFSFFAEKELQLNDNKTCLTIGAVDTISGTWSSNSDKIKIKLEDNTTIEAIIIKPDSLSGFISNNSITGQWIATRK